MTRRRRRLLRVWLPAALIPVVLLSAGALGLWRLTSMAPAWWSPPDPDDEQTTQLAERVEYRLAEETHKVRAEPSPWWIEIRQDQINAWLAARLPAWIAHTHGIQWPAGFGLPQVSLEPGAVRVGLDLETEAGTRYVVAHLAPDIVDGELALTLDGISVGRLWLPGSSVGTVMDRLRHTEAGQFLDDPRLETLLEILDGDRRIDPTLTLSDGRRVRVLDVRCRSDALLLQAQTIAQE
ncbi:MAG: hypothetical protein ACYTE6_10210 [Planctomycetota bacterium]|jgi:hypothetical protein